MIAVQEVECLFEHRVGARVRRDFANGDNLPASTNIETMLHLAIGFDALVQPANVARDDEFPVIERRMPIAGPIRRVRELAV